MKIDLQVVFLSCSWPLRYLNEALKVDIHLNYMPSVKKHRRTEIYKIHNNLRQVVIKAHSVM